MQKKQVVRRERRKKRRFKRNLTYGILALCFIIICFLAYYSLPSQNPSSDGHTGMPKAALVDHLDFIPDTRNESFKEACISILEDAGFNVTYNGGEEVTVDFYRNLPLHDYGLIVLRVHSAAIINTTWVGLFTSEIVNETSIAKHQLEIDDDQLAKAFLPTIEEVPYFGITPRFVQLSMSGRFKKTVIIMMGCEGLKYTSMAEAFIKRGAEVYISWTDIVSPSYTDHSTICLLQSLFQNQTIGTAVGRIDPDPTWPLSKLDYYPKDIGNNVLQDFISGLMMRVIETYELVC